MLGIAGTWREYNKISGDFLHGNFAIYILIAFKHL